MNSKIEVGDLVRLLKNSSYLVEDLPLAEKDYIESFVGSVAKVSEIDPYGCILIGFGTTEEIDDVAKFSGHSSA